MKFPSRLICSWIGASGLATGAFGQTYVQLSIATVGHYTFTSPAGINAKGEIAGTYDDQFGYRGFLRDPSGTITTFDVYGVPDGTKANSINDEGAVTGTWGGGELHTFATLEGASLHSHRRAACKPFLKASIRPESSPGITETRIM